MNLLDLLKPAVADAALPVLPGAFAKPALPLAALPAFADTLAQLQPAPLPPAVAGAGALAPAAEPSRDGSEPAPDAALPPEGLAWLVSPALSLPADAPAPLHPAAEAAPAQAPLVPAGITPVAERPALPQTPEDEPQAAALPALTMPQPLPARPSAAPAEAAAPALRGPARATAALPGATPVAPPAVAAAPREAEAVAAAPTPFEGWLAAQAAEAEPAPAAPLQTALRLPEPPAAAEPGKAWRQPLLVALGDRLQLQIAARSEQAVIRLEPPLLGRIDIAIRHEGGELQVRLAASHAEVGRQLQQLTEPLRQDLLQRHSGEVSVQVSTPAEATRGGSDAQAGGRGASSQQQQQHQQHQERRPGRGLAEEGEAGGFAAPR